MLMNDVFGNHVVQKVFEHGGNAERKHLVSALKGNVKIVIANVRMPRSAKSY